MNAADVAPASSGHLTLTGGAVPGSLLLPGR